MAAATRRRPIWSPDYVKLADAYGIAGWRVENGTQIADAIDAALARPGPALVEFVIEQEANVYPMIPPGASLSEPIEAEPAPAPAVSRMSSPMPSSVLLDDELLTLNASSGYSAGGTFPSRSSPSGRTSPPASRGSLR